MRFFKSPENLRYRLTTLLPILVFLMCILSAVMASNMSEYRGTYHAVIVVCTAAFSSLCTLVVILAITQPLKNLMRQAEQFLRFEKSRSEGGRMIEVYQLIEKLMDIVKTTRRESGEDKNILEGIEKLDYIIPLGYMSLAVAHEVRNPLNTITGMSELLIEGTHDEAARKYLDSILDAAGKIDRFTAELLNFTDEEIVPEEFDLGDATREIVAGLRENFPNVDCEYVNGSPMPYRGDRTKISQAIYNVARNAFEYEQSGGRVRIEAKETGAAYSLEVFNANSRIDEEDLASVFRPFFSKKKGGRGLGLFIGMKNITLHKGSITVKSGGSGTTFIISLPRVLTK